MRRWLCVALIFCSFLQHSQQQQQGCSYNIGFMVSHADIIFDLNPKFDADNKPVYYSNDMMGFIYNLTSILLPSSEGTHMGLVKFGTVASTQWDLNHFVANSGDLLASINAVRISFDGGLSNLADALRLMRTDVMSSSGGGSRNGVQNVCVMITANQADIDQNSFLPEANLTKQLCRLIIVGVGPNATNATSDAYFLPAVTNPSTDFIKVPTFAQLKSTVMPVFNLLCTALSNATATSTVSTTTVDDSALSTPTRGSMGSTRSTRSTISDRVPNDTTGKLTSPTPTDSSGLSKHNYCVIVTVLFTLFSILSPISVTQQ